jgi:hypothetical protein
MLCVVLHHVMVGSPHSFIVHKGTLLSLFSQQSLFPTKDNVSWWDNIYDHELKLYF